MIAADTSSLIAYFEGERASDTELVDRALLERTLVLPPTVLTELLSDPEMPTDTQERVRAIPLLPIDAEYWTRTGLLRARLLREGRKARLGDAQIAQSCLDHDIALIARDDDFDVFAAIAQLRLALREAEDQREDIPVAETSESGDDSGPTTA